MLRRLWRCLPRPARARLWRLADRLGVLPVRLAAGPGRGLTILAPASRRRSYRRAGHERPVLDLLAARLEPGMQFVDAGAYLGYFSLAAAARVGEGGHVWAFEPAAEARRLLERSVRRNRLGNVTVVPMALGAEVGEGRLRRAANPSMSRLVSAGAAGPASSPVAVTTLDAWCGESGARPDLVKIDVEGGEQELLRGAAETLRRQRPLMVVEVHRGAGLEPPETVVELLDAAGYRVRPLAPRADGGLAAALARLSRTPPRPGWLVVLHLLASPR